MGMFHRVQVGKKLISPIDWEMNPDLSFGTFESWGGRERVRNNDERVYYFFVDGWGEEPKLRLMERGVKHAKVLATINAPHELVKDCVENQGLVARFERSFSINEDIKQWLIQHVLDGGDINLIIPHEEKGYVEDMGPALPYSSSNSFHGKTVALNAEMSVITDDTIAEVIRAGNYFDNELNPQGSFANFLTDNGDKLTVTDQCTGLMWQRKGLDIGSLRVTKREIEKINRQGLAGFNDWRLPSMEEAMSLMEQKKNSKGLYINPCFSKEQPFIFVNASRTPGGVWFVDYKQGRAFWSSATIPGGFARLVRAGK